MILSTIKAMRAARARGLVTLSDLCHRVRDIRQRPRDCDCVKRELNRPMASTPGNVRATRFKKSVLFCWAIRLA